MQGSGRGTDGDRSRPPALSPGESTALTPLDTTRCAPEDLLLGRLALEGGLISSEQLKACVEEQERSGGRGLGQILLDRGWVKADALARLLAEQARRSQGIPDLPRYEVRELLGQGATAVVYRAWDVQLKRAVALKILRDSAAVSETVRARFRREAQVAAGLAHPNVVPVHDAGEAGGHLYLVMELVEGRSFADLLRQDKGPEKEIVGLLEQIARGVGAAHAKGIIHRDLKPANILVTPEGVPKVGDFGLAHLVESSTELTRTGATLGTPLYMSPEQVEGRTRELAPATDVYALGAIAYEIATGRPPHTGETTGEIYGKIVRDDPTPPRRLRAAISRDLETIILKALEKDPSRRYATAELFAEDLRRYLAGEPIHARPISAALRIWRKAARKRAVALAALATLALVAVLAAWGLTSSSRKAARIRGTLSHAQAREAEGRLAEAREAFELVVREDGASREARDGLRRTEVELARREREREDRVRAEREALTLLETARPALDEALRTLYDPRATADLIARRVEAARSKIEGALGKAPWIPSAHYLLGRAREIPGDEKGAEQATRKAIELDPDFAPARYQLGRLLLARSYRLCLGATPQEREARKPEAERLAREAAVEIDRSLAQGIGSDDALHGDLARAMLAFVRGRREEVLEAARAGIGRFPSKEGREEFLWLSGLASTGVGEIEELTRALEIRPKWPLVLLARAGARLREGDPEGAVADCDEALLLSPEDSDLLLNRGIARSLRGDLPGAIEDFDRACALRPGDAMVRYNRGVTRLRKGDLDEALGDFGEALRLSPAFAPALNNRAIVRLRRKEYDLAMLDVDQAVRVRPGFAEAWVTRGIVRLRKGDPGGAVEDLDEAIHLDPRRAEAWYNRALARLGKEDLAGAAADLGRAVELKPAWGDPYALRARILAVRGDAAAARKDARRALELGVDLEDRKSLERILEGDP